MKVKLHTISSLHRQEKRRDGCCCCVALPDDYRESSFAKKNLLRTCMNKYIGPVMLSLPGKVSINFCKSDTYLSLIHRPYVFCYRLLIRYFTVSSLFWCFITRLFVCSLVNCCGEVMCSEQNREN